MDNWAENRLVRAEVGKQERRDNNRAKAAKLRRIQRRDEQNGNVTELKPRRIRRQAA